MYDQPALRMMTATRQQIWANLLKMPTKQWLVQCSRSDTAIAFKHPGINIWQANTCKVCSCLCFLSKPLQAGYHNGLRAVHCLEVLSHEPVDNDVVKVVATCMMFDTEILWQCDLLRA